MIFAKRNYSFNNYTTDLILAVSSKLQFDIILVLAVMQQIYSSTSVYVPAGNQLRNPIFHRQFFVLNHKTAVADPSIVHQIPEFGITCLFLIVNLKLSPPLPPRHKTWKCERRDTHAMGALTSKVCTVAWKHVSLINAEQGCASWKWEKEESEAHTTLAKGSCLHAGLSIEEAF